MLNEAIWIIGIDAAIGLLQWVLILRFIYGIFLPENSRLFGVRHINKATDPLIRALNFMTAEWMIKRIRPLYVGFLCLFARVYILPTIFDYDVTGITALSLESLAISFAG